MSLDRCIWLPILGLIGLATWQSAVPQNAMAEQEASAFLGNVNNDTATFPTTRVNKLGYKVNVQVDLELSAATTRVEIDFRSTGGPTTANRQFSIRLDPIPGGHRLPSSSIAAVCSFDVPEGTQSLRVARHVPKTSYGNYYRVKLFEDGREVKDGTARVGSPLDGWAGGPVAIINDAMDRKTLWVNSDIDRESRDQSLRNFMLNGVCDPPLVDPTKNSFASRSSGELTVDLKQIQFRDVERLPCDWRAYRRYSVIVVHSDQWSEWKSAATRQSRALKQWIAMGGLLVVRGQLQMPSSDATSELPELPKGYRNSITTVAGKVKAMASAWPRYDTGENEDLASSSIDDKVRAELYTKAESDLANSLSRFGIEEATAPDRIAVEQLAAGRILHLIATDADEPVELLQWASIEVIFPWQTYTEIRHGVEPILGTSRFFQWVIPGVAQPPVYTFMGLLGLFTILVGPVAYRKSAKAGRSYLMFLIAPILAIGTTLSMLAYGVVADGFGTRTRIRQITWVDGPSGHAVTRTRSTYFAGIRPSNGLTFPALADVTIFRDNQRRGWNERIEDRFEVQGAASVDETEIRLSSELLPSRQQRQFVSHSPTNDWGRIELRRSQVSEVLSEAKNPSESKESGVTAKFEVQSNAIEELREVVLMSRDSEYFFAEVLPAGETVRAVSLTAKEASERLGAMYKRQWLVSALVNRRNRNLGRNNNETYDLMGEQLAAIDTAEKPTDGVFEFELQERMQLSTKLPPGSFVALADVQDTAIAVQGADLVESIHFVMGSLP